VVQCLGQLTSAQQLSYDRRRRPRLVHESPDEFRFESVNYELLLALFSQVAMTDRPAFVRFLLSRISSLLPARRLQTSPAKFPSWNNHISELPLIAEFCIRVGFKGELLHAVTDSPFAPGFVLLLMQLEETLGRLP
jgi:hypothetical protein